MVRSDKERADGFSAPPCAVSEGRCLLIPPADAFLSLTPKPDEKAACFVYELPSRARALISPSAAAPWRKVRNSRHWSGGRVKVFWLFRAQPSLG